MCCNCVRGLDKLTATHQQVYAVSADDADSDSPDKADGVTGVVKGQRHC